MTLETLNAWSTSLTALGLAILWQSTLLVGLVAAVCWLLRRSSPAVRYWCWQLVALKLLLMPLWTLAIPLPGFIETSDAALPGSDATDNSSGRSILLEASAPAGQPLPGIWPAAALAPGSPHWLDTLGAVTWRSWLVLAWLSGVCWQVGRLLIQRRRLGRLLRRAVAATEPHLLALAEDAARQLGLRRAPPVVLVDLDSSPFVCGLFRPLLVLPRGLLAALDAAQWRQVLLHELAHVKRRDLWWGWIPEVARLMYFFHPVVHWVCSRIRLERELACDQLAMALSGQSAADYASVLVEVVGHASLPPALRAAAASHTLNGGEPPNNSSVGRIGNPSYFNNAPTTN